MISKKEKIKIERDFISLLIKYKDLVSDWAGSALKEEYFDSSHQMILNAVIYAFNNDVLLTRKTFVSFLHKYLSSKMEIQAQEYLYNNINTLNTSRDDFPELSSKIVESYIADQTVEYIENYQKTVSAKGSVFASKQLEDKLSSLVVDTEKKKEIFYESVTDYSPTYYEKFVERLEKGEDETNIKCFIKEIDETLVVGFTPGSLVLFCGDVGGYKSTIMLNVAANVWSKGGKDVLYVPLEMPREKMFQKFMSRELQIPFNKLEHPTLLDKDELEKVKGFSQYLKDKEAETGSKFFIMEADDQVPVSVIRKEIEKHVDVFKPSMVVIDYIANLVPDSDRNKGRNDLEIGQMLKGLRTMGKPGAVHEEGFSVVSGAQIGREALKRIRRSGANKTAFYSEDIRGSHEYSADSDAMYVQMEDPQQPGKRINFFCIKSRYGKKMFANNSTRATLEVRPDISLIQSISDNFYTGNQENIMEKINDSDNMDLDFQSDIDDIDSQDDAAGITKTQKDAFEELLGV
jgi:replicative DNA helicase